MPSPGFTAGREGALIHTLTKPSSYHIIFGLGRRQGADSPQIKEYLANPEAFAVAAAPAAAEGGAAAEEAAPEAEKEEEEDEDEDMVRTLLYSYTANADFPRASVCSTKRSFETRRSEWTRAEMGVEDTWQHAYHRPEQIPSMDLYFLSCFVFAQDETVGDQV